MDKGHLMNRENESGYMPSDKSAISSTSPNDPAVASSQKIARDTIINFHSAEFNKTDDLNDCSGNYRTFQSLDGVVTADMRHQMERMHGRNAVGTAADKAGSSKIIDQKRNDAATLDVAPPLTVISQGRTLIIDTNTDHAIACGKLLNEQDLTCTLLVIKKAASDVLFSRRDEFVLMEASATSITGAFGGFSAKVTVGDDQKKLSDWFDKKEIIFDLVLDLQSTPSYAGDRLPMGYFAPGSNPAKFYEAMMELPEMRGRFTKPQFITLLEDRCTHGRSRKSDCRQCLTVCPYDAIQSVNWKVSINHYLCQGCGGCALVCPAEAIRLVHPSWEELLNSLRSKLENRSAEDDNLPTVIISEAETLAVDSGEKNNRRNIYFQVEQIGYVGLEMLLAALIYGAGRVIVACESQDSPNIQNAVEWQTKMAGAILRGLGLPEDKIRFAVVGPDRNAAKKASQTISLDAQTGIAPMPPSTFFLQDDKRTFIRLATQHLYDQSVARHTSLALPIGSPFGAVTVDSSACTLCMACAVNCPSGALIACDNEPKIEFIETRCHQCGLCKETCPEKAIQLQSRLLCDPQIIATPVVLCAAEPFRCVECGEPFASKAMINRMQGKLTGHWMYAAGRQIRRLQMCRTCRTRDALTSEDMKTWNQFQNR